MIEKVCFYRGSRYNILPAILLTPERGSVIIAFKFWNFHLGLKLSSTTSEEIENGETNCAGYRIHCKRSA